jgi:hypothetical protein
MNNKALFTHAEIPFIFRTKDTCVRPFQANPRFISSNQGKNAMKRNAFLIGIFLFKIEITCSKKLQWDVPAVYNQFGLKINTCRLLKNIITFELCTRL